MLRRSVVVTAYDRGIRLIEDLHLTGIKTQIVDYTKALGGNDSLMSGPFGLFVTKSNLDLRTLFNSVGICAPLEQGFVAWFRHGPIEMRGALFDFFKDSFKGDVKLLSEDSLTTDARVWEKQAQIEVNANDRLLRLAAQLSNSEDIENSRYLKQKGCAPILSEYWDYQPAFSGVDLLHEHWRAGGSDVYVAKVLTDVRIDSMGLSAIFFDSEVEKKEVPGTDFFWLLTREETEHLSARCAASLFRHDMQPSVWEWRAFEVVCEPHRLIEEMPTLTVLIDDEFDRLTHANVMALRKTEGGFTVWIKIPTSRLRETVFIKQMKKDMKSVFEKKISGISIHSLDEQPVSSGPRWSIWDPDVKIKNTEVRQNNVFVAGPDAAPRWDREGLCSFEHEVFLKNQKKFLELDVHREAQP